MSYFWRKLFIFSLMLVSGVVFAVNSHMVHAAPVHPAPGIEEKGWIFLGAEPWRWALFALTLLLSYALRGLIRGKVSDWLIQITGKTESTIDDDLLVAWKPALEWIILITSVFLGTYWLSLGGTVDLFITKTYRILMIWWVGGAVSRSVEPFSQLIYTLAARSPSKLDDLIAPVIGRLMRIMTYALMLMLILQEVGVNVAGLIAGLGVGGLAVALAAQDTLANWFGAVMIYTDRPFEVGNWIKTSQLEGVVEEIGMRSTRIRTFAQTVVSIPNRQLANEVIENFSRMPKRRISFKLGVTYDTTPAMLEEAIERIRDILREHPEVDQSFWLVKFTEFGASSLDIFLYYFTNTTDWERYLSVKQEINLNIMQRLNGIGVQFAFPSVSVYSSEIDKDQLSKLDAQARRLFAARTPITQDLRESQVAPSEGNADG